MAASYLSRLSHQPTRNKPSDIDMTQRKLAMQRLLSGVPDEEIARSLGVSSWDVRQWAKDFGVFDLWRQAQRNE